MTQSRWDSRKSVVRGWVFLLALSVWLLAPAADAQIETNYFPEVISREFSIHVGEDQVPEYKEIVSREFSILVTTPAAPVKCLGCGLLARDSVGSCSAIDLDWTAYNELAQPDVARYLIYLGPAFFNDVSALSPYMSVPAQTKRATGPSLEPYGVYYVAAVAQDVLGQTDRVVPSQSAQASVDRVREVQNLAASCGTNSLTFTWLPPAGTDSHTKNLLAAYYAYLAGAATPVVLDRFATSYTVTNLSFGQGHPFRITTVDNQGRESDGASLLAATLALNPAQTVVSSFYGITRVAWQWVQPDEVIEHFLVFMAETPCTSVIGMTPVQTTHGHSVDFHNLVVGKAYYSAVATRNIAGCDSTGPPLRVVAHTPCAAEPTVLQPAGYSNGVFRTMMDGPVGADYVLEGSANLHSCFPLQTNSPAAMPLAVTVMNVPRVDRFYRVLIR